MRAIAEPHRFWPHRHCLAAPLWEVPAGEWMCPECGPGEWLSPVDDSIPVPRLRAAASSPVLEPALYKPGQHVMTRPSWERHSSLTLPSGACAEGSGWRSTKVALDTRLDARSLRPSCINSRGSGGVCGGEMRHTPVESDATVFQCEQCGTQLKSRWW